MMTITIYGLDQYIVGRLSRQLTPLIAKLYGVDEDEISFMAPQLMVFHKGTEQTSWNILIKVDAPMGSEEYQDKMAELLIHGIGEVAIHKTVQFSYYDPENTYQKIDENYPRFISEENLVDVEEEEYQDIEEGEEDDQIYTGDIFEGIK